MRFNHFNDYHQHVAQQIASYVVSAETRKLRQISIGKLRGTVYTGDALLLTNGGTLNLKEEVSIADGEVVFISYAYDYHDLSGESFRYEMTDKGYKPFVHERCHLHVNDREMPRYPTQPISLELVLGFVLSSFPVR